MILGICNAQDPSPPPPPNLQPLPTSSGTILCGASTYATAPLVGGTGEVGKVDYWEEVTVDDGNVLFYNHTAKEYSTSLPITDTTSTTNTTPAHPAQVDEPQPAAAWKQDNNENVVEGWEGGMWDGADGELFVPWSEDVPASMQASPDVVALLGDLPENSEGGVKSCSYEVACKFCLLL